MNLKEATRIKTQPERKLFTDSSKKSIGQLVSSKFNSIACSIATTKSDEPKQANIFNNKEIE